MPVVPAPIQTTVNREAREPRDSIVDSPEAEGGNAGSPPATSTAA